MTRSDQPDTPGAGNIAFAHCARFIAQKPRLTAIPETSCIALGRKLT